MRSHRAPGPARELAESCHLLNRQPQNGVCGLYRGAAGRAGLLASQCLDRRIPDQEMLEREVAAWARRPNLSSAHINWMFRIQNAREKLGKVYPDPEAERQAGAA